jgi:chitinase
MLLRHNLWKPFFCWGILAVVPALTTACVSQTKPSPLVTESTGPPKTDTASRIFTVSPTATAAALPSPAPEGWCSPPGGLPDGFLVAGYLPEYRSLEPSWGNCLSDFIYFSAEPDANGSLDTGRLNPLTLDRMRGMKTRYGTRLHVSVGGYGRSENFAKAVSYPLQRQRFFDELMAFAAANDLDGFDFDWEFPQTPLEINGYVSLIKTIQQAGLTASVAIIPLPGIDLAPFLGIDRIHVMSYDNGPRHSTYEQAVADLGAFLRAGYARSQLVLGIPFYGRKTSSPFTSYPYSDIQKTFEPPPDTDEVEDIFFNGIATIQKKVCYAKTYGFGGIMMWELGQDSTDDASLLRAVYSALANGCPP